MKKFFLILLILFVLLFAVLATGAVYLYKNEFSVPKVLKSRATTLTKYYYGLDVDFENFKVNIPNNNIDISSFTLSVTDKTPFVSVSSASIQLASSAKMIEMISEKAVVDKIILNNLIYDLTSPQLEEASGPFKLPSVPAKEIILNGFIINTPYGKFDLSENSAYLNKENNNVDFLLDIPNGPFGIKGKLASKIDLDTKIASISLKVDIKNLLDCNPLILFASKYNVGIKNGILMLSLDYNGNIEKRINSPLDDIYQLLNDELQGDIKINDLDVSYENFNYKGSINIYKIHNEVWNYSLKGRIASGEVDVSGKWLGNEDSPTKLESDFSINDIIIPKENLIGFGMPDINFSAGCLGLKGKILGDIASFSAKGNIYAKNWYFYDKKLDKVNISWNLRNDLSIIAKGNFESFLGSIDASSTIWLSGENKNKAVLEGNINKLELNEIGAMVNIPIDGKCKGPFVAELDILNPLKSVYTFNGSIENSDIYSFKSQLVTGSVTGIGADWKVNNPYVKIDNTGEIVTNGFVSSSSIDLAVKMKDVNLQNFGVQQEIASGLFQLEGNLSGDLTRPKIKGSFWGDNLTIMDMPLKSFKAEIKEKDGIISLAPIVVKPIDGSFVDGYISIDLSNSKILNARVNFQQFCLELLRSYIPINISSKQIDGVLNGFVSYSRRNEANFTKAVIEGKDLSIFGQDIESVYLEAEAIGSQIDLKSFFIKCFGGRLNLTGQFLDFQKFAGSVEGENLKFNRMNHLMNFLPNLEGSLDLQGDIDWDGKRRKGNFNIFGREIKSNDRELGNYGGEIIIDDEKLEIRNGEFDNLGIQINGDLMWGSRQPYNLKLKFNNVDFSFIPQSHDMNIFENGSLIIGGECNVQGDLASLTPDFVCLNLDNLLIQKDEDIINTNKPINIVYQNGSTEIRSLELKYNTGIIAVEGIISSNKNIAVHIDGDNFSAKALGHLFGLKNINYDGDIFLDARLFGTTNDIKYSANAEIKQFKVEDREIPEVKAKIEGNSSELKVEETFIKLKNSSFNLKGGIKLNNFVPENLDIKLTIPKSPISDLVDYFPKYIKTAIGSIVGELSISGKPTNPEITGDLHLDGNKIQFTNMKKPFTNIEFDMTTDDMITTINSLKASMGKGSINGYGTIDFKNALGDLDIHLRTEKLDLPFLSLEINNASASLDLTGDIYNPIVNSYIFIPRGKLGLNSSMIPETSDSKPIFDSLKYRVDIEIPRNFWVKNAFLNAEMKGKCTVSGDLNNIKIDGGISTIQGKIFFKQRQFKIQNGEIKFGGVDNSLDPYIYVKSEGQVQSTKIYLTLQGNISNFKPQVYSTPPMSEGDIIAMLTLGRDLNSVSNSNTKELFEDEVLEGLKNSYISALIGDSLSSALNLDELYLTSAFDKKTGKSQSYVRIGKYLSDKFFMAYEGTMSEDKDESYIFEYRLPKGFIFSIEFEQPEKNQNYGLRYDWKF